jgi:hypothetical protein
MIIETVGLAAGDPDQKEIALGAGHLDRARVDSKGLRDDV